ncbi:prephenate dehydrogenase [Candidatus Kaiserbacteria bacterium]|nr:prephenate dehydrogenase [Candidatus Kaiserbacteria bacterium]
MKIQSVGIIGYGAFGPLAEKLLKKFAKGLKIKVWGRERALASKKFAQLQEVAKCDVVILAVPIRNYDEVLEMIRPYIRSDTIVVDIATVKSYTQSLVKEKFSTQPRLHIHPMFGPGSFKRTKGSVEGFPIVVTQHTFTIREYRALKKFAKRCGFQIVEMTVDEHDRRISETLFIAHLQSQTLKRSGFLKKTAFDTPSVRLMKEAAEIVSSDTELFRDVVHYNKYCRDAMIHWQEAQSFIWKLLIEAK